MSGRLNLILMDCQMPVMDGFDATAAIRSAERPGQRVAIVALTASVMDSDRDRCLASGMDDVLRKPIRIPDLERLLLRLSVPAEPSATG